VTASAPPPGSRPRSNRPAVSPLPVLSTEDPCWQRIGVWGDRTCPELAPVTHCHNCPVFASAGRRFLDGPSPADYLDEWTRRLAAPEDESAAGRAGVLVFRLAEEWLALPVDVLVEVTHMRSPHRVPHRRGLLAGLVNIRGELHLCVKLDQLLGIAAASTPAVARSTARLVVIRKDTEGWVFAADEVDQVHRVADRELLPSPPTLSRASARVTRAVFTHAGRAVGLLDDDRLFQALRERVR